MRIIDGRERGPRSYRARFQRHLKKTGGTSIRLLSEDTEPCPGVLPSRECFLNVVAHAMLFTL